MEADGSPRLRWLLRGHESEAVEAALDGLRSEIASLRDELATAQELVGTHQRHAEDAMFLARRLAAQEAELERRLAAGPELEAEQRAAAEAGGRATVAAAEEEAARVRATAYDQLAEIGAQVEILLFMKDRAIAELADLRAERAALESELASAGRPEADASDGDVVLDRAIEVHARPIPDFIALAEFERALGALSGVQDVHVVRFDTDQAVIDLRADRDLRIGDLRRAIRGAGAVGLVDAHTVTIDLS
jgi:chromosome segregation ATPase